MRGCTADGQISIVEYIEWMWMRGCTADGQISIVQYAQYTVHSTSPVSTYEYLVNPGSTALSLVSTQGLVLVLCTSNEHDFNRSKVNTWDSKEVSKN
jgi:hypothetical protein